jgi:surfactin synthase thioesterase subunit
VAPPDPSEAEFLEQLEAREGIPREVRANPDLMRLLLPALGADAAIYRNYVYVEEPPLTCPIVAYGGAEDPHVRREHLETWRSETTAEFALRMLPGGHFFLHTGQREFLTTLFEDLARVTQILDATR